MWNILNLLPPDKFIISKAVEIFCFYFCTSFSCEIWSSNGDEDFDVGLLVFDVVWTCRWISTFRRELGDGTNKFLRSADVYLQVQTALTPRRPTSTSFFIPFMPLKTTEWTLETDRKNKVYRIKHIIGINWILMGLDVMIKVRNTFWHGPQNAVNEIELKCVCIMGGRGGEGTCRRVSQQAR
jgi:hypothetical protein